MPAIGMPAGRPSQRVVPTTSPARATAGQQGARDVEQGEELVVPVEVVDVEEQRARGVARVGDVGVAPGQAPGEPGVDGAEGELAALGAPARPGHRRRGARRAWSRRSRRRARSPVRSRNPAPCPACRSASHRDAVRRSCQTMALATARPVARSHSTVVSRWLVMPMAATSAARKPRLGERPGGDVALAGEQSPRGRAPPSRAAGRSGGILAVRRRWAARRDRRRWRGSWSCPGRGRGWLSSGDCRRVDDTIKCRSRP